MRSEGPHIVVELSDRLGNQLFQFAAARQFELDGASISFSDRTAPAPGLLPNSAEKLGQFTGEKLTFASPLQELATGYLPRSIFNSASIYSWLRAPIVLPTRRRIVKFTDFASRPAALPTWSIYRIVGYFQHRSWFERSLGSVLAQIEGTTKGARTQLPAFDLCVHLRRGDYVSRGWDLSYEYYAQSMALMPSSVSTVVVTSDDRLVARAFAQNLRSDGFDACTSDDAQVNSLSSNQNRLDPVVRDFCLIATSKHVVMSNSTFCWWAVALGDSIHDDSGDRIVAYPRGWVMFPDDESDGLIRAGWIQISA